MDLLLPVLLPCPLCSAQQQLSAQTAALHLWRQEQCKTNYRPRRQSASLNDLSNTETTTIVDGIYRAEHKGQGRSTGRRKSIFSSRRLS